MTSKKNTATAFKKEKILLRGRYFQRKITDHIISKMYHLQYLAYNQKLLDLQRKRKMWSIVKKRVINRN